ncbi:MAG: putative solute binding protein [Myxococcales bacterium]|nr:putative solute binding protein [Myxococcales bacterium]
MRYSGGVFALAATLACATAAAEPQARLTAHLVGEPATALTPVRTGVAETYSGDGRLLYRPLSELVPETVEDPAAALKKADDDLEEGDKAFSGMDIAPARQRLEAAVAGYATWLPELIQRDGGTTKLQTAWVLLAKAYFFDGDAGDTKTALRHCLTLDSQLAYKANVFPPQMKRAVSEVRLQYEVAGLGKLRVETTPKGATVYVDGVVRPGLTPQTLELESGPHDVRLELAGHKRAVLQAEVPGGGAVELSAALPAAPSNADATFASVRARLDDPMPPAELARVAEKLGVELIAIVTVSPLAAGRVSLRGWLYDARRNLVLKRATREAAGSDEELRLSGRYFAQALIAGVRLDGRPEPPPHRDTFAEKWQRFRESKWFWPVVGGVAGLALTGAAVGVGVGVSQRRGVDDDAASAVVLTGGH